MTARGEVHLLRRIPGYKKIRFYSHENIGFGNINLPDQEMHTSAVWWQLAPQALEQAFASRHEALDGFLGAAHALHLVAVLLAMAEPRDLGRAVGDGDAKWFATVDPQGRGRITDLGGEEPAPQSLDRFRPAVFLYDNYPGGIGLSTPLYEQRHRVVERAAALVGGCGCHHGCPACIGPILASDEGRGFSPKQAAARVLDLLRQEPPG